MARAKQIPRPKMPTKLDELMTLIFVIPIARPIPRQQYHQHPVTKVTQSPCHTQANNREVTRGTLDASPITRSHPLFTSLENLVGNLEGKEGQFEERLDGHDIKFEEHENKIKH